MDGALEAVREVRMERKEAMKTLTLMATMLALCGACIAADKPNPQAVAKERQARYQLASDFRRVADKLTADEVKAVQAIVSKHAVKKPATAEAPVTKSAPAKKK